MDYDYMDEVIDEGAGDGSEEAEEDPLASEEEEEEEENGDGSAADRPVDVRKFFDQEAELSGSGSSDEEEEEEGGDEYEGTEEADAEDVGDADAQRESIAKLFHKQEADADRRTVLLMQERIFEDGDLHLDGKQRRRRFRWRNASATAWIDPTDRSSGEEDEGDNPFPVVRSGDVVVNFKKDMPGGEEGAGTSGTGTDPQQQPQRTVPVPAFGGRADSILSYVIKDRKTCELLSSMKRTSPAYAPFLKKTVKKHRIRTKTLFA